MTDDREIRFLGDVARLDLKPDDIIVLRTHHTISAEQIERVEEYVARKTGLRNRVIVLVAGLEIGLLAPEQPA